MNVLITGSAGFLGTHTAAACKVRGWRVNGVDVRGAIPMDYRKIDGFGQMLGLDTLIHFAGFTSLNGFEENLAENYANNVSGFIDLLDKARRAGVRKVVYASSSAVYCDGRDMNFREEESIDHNYLTSHYGKSKLMDEMIAASFADAFSMNLLGLRFFNVYGAGDELKGNRCAPVQHFANARKNGEPIKIYFDGEQAKDFIHVSDAVECTMRLIEADARGIYNVGTGKATTFNRCAEIIGGPVEYVPHPSPFGYQFFTQSDNTKLLSTIGPYQFMSIEEGLKQLCA